MGLPWDIEEVLSMYDANRLQMGNGWHQRFFGNLNASMLHKSTLKKSLPCFFPIIGQGELRCPNDCSLEPSQKMRKDDRLLFIDTRFSACFMLDNPLVLPITKRSMQLMLHWEIVRNDFLSTKFWIGIHHSLYAKIVKLNFPQGNFWQKS